MIRSENFSCKRCGECCRELIVKLYKKEIDDIKKAGFGKDFFSYDPHIRSHVLKKTRGKCIFLGKKEREFYCRIYEIRPRVCREYPFVNSLEVENCKPILFKNCFVKKGFSSVKV
jgi:Fe-S-cluster containining protein